MSFFIADAMAQAPAGAAQEPSLLGFLPLVVIFIVFWFLLIRPQQKRAKEHRQMVENLAKGDEVVTTGGLLGRITKLGENFVVVEIAEGIEVKVQKQMVASLMPKGTSKSL
ncbi:preprotein translocase subunit YajC [Thioalbus denitrificans]|jgi:preprotein translocase subunit YajC|uniref:Sec translocon accessory complex subunit YajC n=1 Tax=Thioalbus denitrificans TaxID=547122 RepID=A0A369CE31_9GAMM|nr:preprotein translocase subunit YajC [Thioalbus denitrificans]RCX31821.1 protein translocase subunit yajC [Thioalbus denitrificans]